jgi:hypothetical protein
MGGVAPLHPSVALRLQFYNAILNGLKVFKINGTDGRQQPGWAQTEPVLAARQGRARSRQRGGARTHGHRNMDTVMGGTAGGAAALVVWYQEKKSRDLVAACRSHM